MPRLHEDGVAIARRVSGGGTVYHDEGNLNFSLMLPRGEYDLARQFKMVQAALLSVGIAAARTGTNSLAVDGRKFSGNAFCLRRNTSLHHGTLLVHSDLARLVRYLKPSLPGIETKAIASVPAPVVNLGAINPSISFGSLVDALAVEFTARYGPAERIAPDQFDAALVAPYEEKMRQWSWIFGHTPRFSVDVAGRGRVDVEDGFVAGTRTRFEA